MIMYGQNVIAQPVAGVLLKEVILNTEVKRRRTKTQDYIRGSTIKGSTMLKYV